MQPRLKKRPDFLRVAKKGSYCPASTLIVQYLPHESLKPDCTPTPRPGNEQGVRVGFTASRKVGNAVERNRAKRRLREAFELVFQEFSLDHCLLSHCDVVIIAKNISVNSPFEILLRDLRYALKRCLTGKGLTSKGMIKKDLKNGEVISNSIKEVS